MFHLLFLTCVYSKNTQCLNYLTHSYLSLISIENHKIMFTIVVVDGGTVHSIPKTLEQSKILLLLLFYIIYLFLYWLVYETIFGIDLDILSMLSPLLRVYTCKICG